MEVVLKWAAAAACAVAVDVAVDVLVVLYVSRRRKRTRGAHSFLAANAISDTLSHKRHSVNDNNNTNAAAAILPVAPKGQLRVAFRHDCAIRVCVCASVPRAREYR